MPSFRCRAGQSGVVFYGARASLPWSARGGPAGNFEGRDALVPVSRATAWLGFYGARASLPWVVFGRARWEFRGQGCPRSGVARDGAACFSTEPGHPCPGALEAGTLGISRAGMPSFRCRVRRSGVVFYGARASLPWSARGGPVGNFEGRDALVPVSRATERRGFLRSQGIPALERSRRARREFRGQGCPRSGVARDGAEGFFTEPGHPCPGAHVAGTLGISRAGCPRSGVARRCRARQSGVVCSFTISLFPENDSAH
jgi:hypothetical protein